MKNRKKFLAPNQAKKLVSQMQANFRTQQDLAEFLGVTSSAIVKWRQKGIDECRVFFLKEKFPDIIFWRYFNSKQA